MKEFTVIDLASNCEIRARAQYSYELLDQVEGAAELIGRLSGAIWASPDRFELAPAPAGELIFHWGSTSPSSGIATLRRAGQTLSISLLCSGLDPDADQITLKAFHSHILRELHDTRFEPSFDMLQIDSRPLLITLGLFAPSDPSERSIFAMVDRCFAAALFRRLQII